MAKRWLHNNIHFLHSFEYELKIKYLRIIGEYRYSETGNNK